MTPLWGLLDLKIFHPYGVMIDVLFDISPLRCVNFQRLIQFQLSKKVDSFNPVKQMKPLEPLKPFEPKEFNGSPVSSSGRTIHPEYCVGWLTACKFYRYQNRYHWLVAFHTPTLSRNHDQ